METLRAEIEQVEGKIAPMQRHLDYLKKELRGAESKAMKDKQNELAPLLPRDKGREIGRVPLSQLDEGEFSLLQLPKYWCVGRDGSDIVYYELRANCPQPQSKRMNQAERNLINLIDETRRYSERDMRKAMQMACDSVIEDWRSNWESTETGTEMKDRILKSLTEPKTEQPLNGEGE